MMFWWGFFLEDFSGGEGGGDLLYSIYLFLSFQKYMYTYAENQNKIFWGGGRVGGEPPRSKLLKSDRRQAKDSSSPTDVGQR